MSDRRPADVSPGRRRGDTRERYVKSVIPRTPAPGRGSAAVRGARRRGARRRLGGKSPAKGL